MFLLKFLYHTYCADYFYRPYRPMIWHPLYDDKTLTTGERRRLRDDSLPDEWTWQVWDAACTHWHHACAGCDTLYGHLQQDHLIPVAHRDCPGKVPSNLLPLCAECNKDKSASDFAEWHLARFWYQTLEKIDHIHRWQVYCLKRGWR